MRIYMCTKKNNVYEGKKRARERGKQKEGMNEKTSMNGALLQRIIIKNEKMSVFSCERKFFIFKSSDEF